tara:strand:+ start:162 stop:854 length:693 start_codon:yes stop_codon:yes gene_type:complete
MGYLDNSSITVDAILTKRGRELLARNDGSFRVTQFALGDDEIDYTLFNEDHPNGSQYSGEAIENMPLLEAFPDENNIMLHKLVTLPRGTSKLPVIVLNVEKVKMTLGSQFTLEPKTMNFNNSNNVTEPGGYFMTIADRRLLADFTGTGTTEASSTVRPYTSTAVSETITGTTANMRAINSTTLFGVNQSLLTTLTIEGRDSGARATIPLEITKKILARRSVKGESGIQLR